MEEAATLRGTLSAIQTQLAAAQSAAEASEAARQRSSADAASLQAELQQVLHLTWRPQSKPAPGCLGAGLSLGTDGYTGHRQMC